MDSFRNYAKEVTNKSNALGLLTKEEELSLGVKIQKGDMKARDALVEANLRLVMFIARGLASKTNSISELVSEGNIGLIKAADRFNPEKDVRFSTYAYILIKGAIIRFKELTEFSGSVANAMPYLKFKRINAHYFREHGVNMPHDEMAQVMDITEDKLNRIIDDGTRGIVSMNSCIDGEEYNLEEVIADECDSAEDSLSKSSIGGKTEDLMGRSNLDERERYIVYTHLGFGSNAPKDLTTISKDLGISNSRTSQLYDRAVRKIRYRAIKMNFNDGCSLVC